MAQAFCCIGSEMIYIVKLMICKKLSDKLMVSDRAFDKGRLGVYIFFETTAQVIYDDDLMTHFDKLICDVSADESRSTCD